MAKDEVREEDMLSVEPEGRWIAHPTHESGDEAVEKAENKVPKAAHKALLPK
ncbi:hypothetical protein BGE01nite_01970 [Brevifollis gellanilyticus]|uniref:Uncharacterized protein n=1 Tax=Brevifollis gellanilyticus TaxID=748831 RepID=A0A512M2E4_9BACT|nr:hypothetical protein BGE01nite_01970 [Brevifollis gellanilyticus]